MDWLAVPLMEQGIVVGIISVQSYQRINQDLEEDLDLLNFIAQQVNAAITRFHDQAQLKRAVDARTRELMAQIREREHAELLQESLFKISELSNDSSIEIDKFYYQVHNIVGQLINAENFYIAKYDEATEYLSFVFFTLDQNNETSRGEYESRMASNHYTELVVKRKKTVLLNQSSLQALYEQGKPVNPILKLSLG